MSIKTFVIIIFISVLFYLHLQQQKKYVPTTIYINGIFK